MKGFDPKWRDFPDYILGITKEIWEDRNISGLHHWYTDDLAVRTPSSIVRGNKDVIAATMATLAEFPDRQLLGEDVIWSGSEDEGFLSSHRILTMATHSQPGVYGDATGTRLTYRVLADCAAINDQIFDEWMVRDQGAIVRQLGWEAKAFARNLIEREGGPESCVRPLTPESDAPGRYRGRGNDHEIGYRHAEILTRIMGAEMSVIATEYDRACHLELPGGVTGHGHADADRFWMGLRASFPSAEFQIDHRIGRSDEHMPARAAVRWSLHGKHDGFGTFGAPTGADVYVMGISHAEFGPWGLRRDYTLIDETAIWKQILLQTG
ncbi:MAG: nuclear transport factor 2 family protein [Geminicoccaceae bacterium]